MSTLPERQVRPIYEALDTGSNKSAIVACNKLLKKHPKNELIKALKALAFVRSQKVEESLILCDEVLAAKPTNDAVLTAMMHVLRGLGRHNDMVTIANFLANVRILNWKAAQQIATRMQKQFQEDRYIYWSVISAILQANDPMTAPNMRKLLYKLAHRLVTSSPTPSYVNADRFHLHLSILRELELFDEAQTLLESDIGQSICSASLSCNEIRRDIWRLRGLLKEEGIKAEQRITEKNDRNWLEFISVLDATFSYVTTSQVEVDTSPKAECSLHAAKTQELFTKLAANTNDLRRLINSHKLLRHNLSPDDLILSAENDRVTLYKQQYLEGLRLGADLPMTELQPADDLVILAGNVFVSLWKMSGEENYLYNAVALLEFALTKSKQSFQVRLMLIRIYRLLGAPSLALEHYRVMQIKQVQHDTLSHFLLSRSSTFSLAATGDLTFATECLESTQIYISNTQDTGDYIVRAFTGEKYSQIPEFITFEDRLDNSLQRDVVKIEHLRMRLTHEAISSDIIDMELIELKFIFDRLHHDNRDFEILADYQPRSGEKYNEQTLLFGKSEGARLENSLSMFIVANSPGSAVRAFQQGSDLDDSVEEKLLIGASTGTKEEELAELTSDECSFINYANALADWLEPYHDHARPPPAVVLAEAAKLAELKTGHPLKGVEIPPKNGNGTANGSAKKEEEAPPVTDPPTLVLKYFDGTAITGCFVQLTRMWRRYETRFEEVKAVPSPSLALHVATLMQEAFLVFVIETLRFKTPSVVKVNKLGALVQQFKQLRSNAIAVLREVSADLIKRGAQDDGSPFSGGGGFIQNSPGGSQGSPGAATKSAASQSLRPVTVAQLRKASQMHSEADWMVDDYNSRRDVLAKVYNTNRNFGIDDGTGRMDAKMWIDTPNERQEEIWRGINHKDEHIYVRVTGALKTHNGKKHIHASNIRLVKDSNEVYFHLLEVISVHITLQKGLPPRPGQEQQQPAVQGQSAYAVQSRPNNLPAMFSPLADKVVNYLDSLPKNPEGTFVGDIAKALNADPMDLSLNLLAESLRHARGSSQLVKVAGPAVETGAGAKVSGIHKVAVEGRGHRLLAEPQLQMEPGSHHRIALELCHLRMD
ncbi:N-acetyltransferase B complex non catalytic subunit-domain-containing protein [Mycena sp. CBHHK59/15]|nr:N-acetyltransferase B complex non catalytic subunit-domain-containing protein [Mycena sp. CBHHK59/15]